MTARVAKAAKKTTTKEPKLKRGKAMNLYLHEPDEVRLKDLGTFVRGERGSVSKCPVIKAALIAADADHRLLKAFDLVKSCDLRFKK